MYWLLIEIPYYQKIAKLNKLQITQLQDDLDSYCQQLNIIITLKEENHMLLKLPEPQNNHNGNVLKQVFIIKNVLEKWKDNLLGYSMLIDVFSKKISEHDALRDMIENINTTTAAQEMTYLGSKIWYSMSHLIEAPADGTCRKIINDTPTTQTYINIPDFAYQPLIVEKIITYLTQRINNDITIPPLLLCGNKNRGTIYNLYKALTTICGKPHTWLHIKGDKNNSNWMLPYIYSMKHEHVLVAAKWLTHEEQHIWNEYLPFLNTILDAPSHYSMRNKYTFDFYRLYYIYVKSWMRRMEAELYPPFIVLENADEITQRGANFLARFLHKLQCNPLILCTAAREFNPTYFGLQKCTSISIPAMSHDDLQRKTEELHIPLMNTGPHIGKYFTHTNGDSVLLYHKIYHDLKNRLASPQQSQSIDHTKIISDTLPAPLDDTTRARLTTEKFIYSRLPKKEHVLAKTIFTLQPIELEILYAAALFAGTINTSLFYTILTEMGINDYHIPNAIERLALLGLLSLTTPLQSIDPTISYIIREYFSVYNPTLAIEFKTIILEKIKDETIPNTINLLKVIETNQDSAQSLEIFSMLIFDTLNARNFEHAADFLYDNIPLIPWIKGLAEIRSLQALLFSGRMRLAALQNDIIKQRELFAKRPDIHNCGIYSAMALIECARYNYREGRIKDIAPQLKKAIFIYQQEKNLKMVVSVYIEYIIYYLAIEKIKDANWYLLTIQKQEITTYNSARCAILRLVVDFLQGRLSSVIQSAKMMEAQTNKMCMREYQLLILFIHARTLFHLGQYNNADALLAQARCIARTYNIVEAMPLLQVWQARCHLYNNKPRHALHILNNNKQCRDAIYFLAETHYFMGNKKEAINCLDKILTTSFPLYSGMFEALEWKSGYDYLEDMAIYRSTGEIVIRCLARSFRNYIVSTIGESSTAISDMYRLTRTKKVSEQDPHIWYYLFLYYLILKHKPVEGSEDRFAVLGKAIRLLQMRLKNISHYEDRISFQKSNIWIQRLIAHATQHSMW